MSEITPETRRFAERLIAYEGQGRSKEGSRSALRVCARMQPHLASLMGQAGYKALLGRALALGREESSWLLTVELRPDGTLEEGTAGAAASAADVEAGGRALIVQLLGLLAAFVGENLTLRLMGEAWPELSFQEFNSLTGDGLEEA